MCVFFDRSNRSQTRVFLEKQGSEPFDKHWHIAKTYNFSCGICYYKHSVCEEHFPLVYAISLRHKPHFKILVDVNTYMYMILNHFTVELKPN